MRTLKVAWVSVAFCLAAFGANAQEKGTQNKDQPPGQATTAQAVDQVVKYAKQNKDPEAYLVAARMLSQVKEPISKSALDGGTSQNTSFSDKNKPQCYTVGSLLKDAKQTAKGDKELVAKIESVQEAGREEQFVPVGPVCFWGYCHYVYGCWSACY